MPGGLRYDSEWQAYANGPQPILKTAAELRDHINGIYSTFASIPQPTNIIKTVYMVPSLDGTMIELARFATREQLDATCATNPQPAILYMHGGGMISGSNQLFSPLLSANAAASGIQIWSVDYRLAPEHPYPTPLHDCLAAFQYIHSYHTGLGIDQSRIAVMGESAGGCLAAGLALMARNMEILPPIAKQILIQPMLDDRTVTRIPRTGNSTLHKFLRWSAGDNAIGWESYLGSPRKADAVDFEAADKGCREKEGRGVPSYAAPLRCEDLSRLPSTYVDVGGLDLFKVENTLFVSRLAAAEVEVEFHLYPGVPHGFEGAPVPISSRATENKLRAMRSF